MKKIMLFFTLLCLFGLALITQISAVTYVDDVNVSIPDELKDLLE